MLQTQLSVIQAILSDEPVYVLYGGSNSSVLQSRILCTEMRVVEARSVIGYRNGHEWLLVTPSFPSPSPLLPITPTTGRGRAEREGRVGKGRATFPSGPPAFRRSFPLALESGPPVMLGPLGRARAG